MYWLILVLWVCSHIVDIILVKAMASESRELPIFSDPMPTLLSWPIWLHLLLYSILFLLFIYELNTFVFNVAYSVSTIEPKVIVTLLSMIYFKSPFDLNIALSISFVIICIELIKARFN